MRWTVMDGNLEVSPLPSYCIKSFKMKRRPFRQHCLVFKELELLEMCGWQGGGGGAELFGWWNDEGGVIERRWKSLGVVFRAMSLVPGNCLELFRCWWQTLTLCGFHRKRTELEPEPEPEPFVDGWNASYFTRRTMTNNDLLLWFRFHSTFSFKYTL